VIVALAGLVIIGGAVVISALGISTRLREATLLVVLAGGGLLVVALVGAVLLTGVGIRGDHKDSTPSATPTTTTLATTVVTTTTSTVTTATVGSAADSIEGPDVYMQASTVAGYGSTPEGVDRLAGQSVLRITAKGFEPNSTGLVEQCTVAGCANAFPVLFDATGGARLQYLVGDAFAAEFEPPSRCRADEPPCVVHVHSNDDSAFLTTFFHDVAPGPRSVAIEPSAGSLADGTRVRVTVAGFNPGERVQAMLCAAPDTFGPTRCGAPGPVSSFTIGAGGRGRTVLVIREGRVGSAGVACGRGATCGIVVAHARSSVPAPVIPIAFAAGPAARYDPFRSLSGLTAAFVLLLVAFFVARSTDWRKPTEADTPELDRAVLTD
jgi:hypothetical protein